MKKLPLLRRDYETPKWAGASPRIGIVYSAENWSQVEPLVNELRYELTDNYSVSPISIKITQAESVHEIAIHAIHAHQRSDIVFAVGVVLRDSPLHQERLMELLTSRLGAASLPGRLPVFDCVLVKDSAAQLAADLARLEEDSTSAAKVWAKRAMDALAILSKPAN
ncbi:hypothetical protein H4S06_006515 [Coemansia sp. BCRC 34490]|nr:hypothetical protein LPJ72_004012 [Coemansia sp. Benny D160-2]KAJ2738045.1 hypothetical protein H4S06_006515 [Coemansia sp. BCRC 34490]